MLIRYIRIYVIFRMRFSMLITLIQFYYKMWFSTSLILMDLYFEIANFHYTPCQAATSRIGTFNKLFAAGKAMGNRYVLHIYKR